jgi:NADPH:quinone reductase-like Zn-dependent oxidoreductase
MRYYKFSAAERKLTLAEAERPEPGPGQIRVKVAAASLNYRDPYMISRFREVGIDNRIPLSDASGTVDAVGDGAMRFQPGDRVATIFFPDWISGRFRSNYAPFALGGERADGVLSEYLIVPERALVASPPFLSDVQVASLPCAAVTAWHALFVRAPLEPGDRVLIQGTGGVALFALQFAYAAGVRCIVLSSSDDKLERARKLGASDLINYRNTPDWHLAVHEITQGEGATHILELGGKDTYERSMQCIAANGTIAQIGVLTGFDVRPNLLPLTRLNANVAGIQVGSREHFEEMNRFIEEHRIAPVVDREFTFVDALQAFEHMAEQRHFGKLVINVAGARPPATLRKCNPHVSQRGDDVEYASG